MIAMSTRRGSTARDRRRVIGRLVFRGCVLVLTLLLARAVTWAADCQNSPVLFAFRGSLYAGSAGQDPIQIASGFKSPSDITWAPKCEHYALIDSGALWVGSGTKRPSRATLPGPVLGYRWGRDGVNLAATVRPSACERRTGLRAFEDEGDVFIVIAPGLSGRVKTSDCQTRPLGWASGGNQIILYQQVLGPCPDTVSVCPTGNIIAVNVYSNSASTLIKAAYLRKKKLDDPEVVKWDEQRGVLYIRSTTSTIGGLGALLAVRVPSGEILWSVESYGATLLSDGQIANLDRKPTSLEKTGFNWEWQYQILREGKIIEKYAPQPTSGGGEQGVISPDGKFVWWQPQGSQTEVRFGTKTDADIWGMSLPPGFRLQDGVWTPKDHLVIQAYKRTPRAGLVLAVWVLDPASKSSAKLFGRNYPLPSNPYEDFTQYSSVRLPNGTVKNLHNPLVIARWAR